MCLAWLVAVMRQAPQQLRKFGMRVQMSTCQLHWFGMWHGSPSDDCLIVCHSTWHGSRSGVLFTCGCGTIRQECAFSTAPC
eukprot:6535736-Alexandrium_andersonii.AAC.1